MSMSVSGVNGLVKAQPVGYKGTAFGDPLKVGGADLKGTGKSTPVSSITNQSKTNTIANQNRDKVMSTKSYPVDFKGTAFGDPAYKGKTVGNIIDMLA